MQFLRSFRAVARVVLDYALPLRCPGCGFIVGPEHGFCGTCWNGMCFIGEPCCHLCGVPIETQIDAQATCGSCMAHPPPWTSARAALIYDDISASIAMRLKYGRRVGLSRLMARYMVNSAPVSRGQAGLDWLILPVPLHRWRLWHRGFNQSLLISHHIARELEVPVDPFLLTRTKPTRSLRSMTPRERERTVRGAFAIAPGGQDRLRGKSVILVDDVLTSGATARACTRELICAGAAAVHLLSWARVVHSVSSD